MLFRDMVDITETMPNLTKQPSVPSTEPDDNVEDPNCLTKEVMESIIDDLIDGIVDAEQHDEFVKTLVEPKVNEIRNAAERTQLLLSLEEEIEKKRWSPWRCFMNVCKILLLSPFMLYGKSCEFIERIHTTLKALNDPKGTNTHGDGIVGWTAIGIIFAILLTIIGELIGGAAAIKSAIWFGFVPMGKVYSAVLLICLAPGMLLISWYMIYITYRMPNNSWKALIGKRKAISEAWKNSGKIGMDE